MSTIGNRKTLPDAIQRLIKSILQYSGNTFIHDVVKILRDSFPNQPDAKYIEVARHLSNLQVTEIMALITKRGLVQCPKVDVINMADNMVCGLAQNCHLNFRAQQVQQLRQQHQQQQQQQQQQSQQQQQQPQAQQYAQQAQQFQQVPNQPQQQQQQLVPQFRFQQQSQQQSALFRYQQSPQQQQQQQQSQFGIQQQQYQLQQQQQQQQQQPQPSQTHTQPRQSINQSINYNQIVASQILVAVLPDRGGGGGAGSGTISSESSASGSSSAAAAVAIPQASTNTQQQQFPSNETANMQRYIQPNSRLSDGMMGAGNTRAIHVHHHHLHANNTQPLSGSTAYSTPNGLPSSSSIANQIQPAQQQQQQFLRQQPPPQPRISATSTMNINQQYSTQRSYPANHQYPAANNQYPAANQSMIASRQQQQQQQQQQAAYANHLHNSNNSSNNMISSSSTNISASGPMMMMQSSSIRQVMPCYGSPPPQPLLTSSTVVRHPAILPASSNTPPQQSRMMIMSSTASSASTASSSFHHQPQQQQQPTHSSIPSMYNQTVSPHQYRPEIGQQRYLNQPQLPQPQQPQPPQQQHYPMLRLQLRERLRFAQPQTILRQQLQNSSQQQQPSQLLHQQQQQQQQQPQQSQPQQQSQSVPQTVVPTLRGLLGFPRVDNNNLNSGNNNNSENTNNNNNISNSLALFLPPQIANSPISEPVAATRATDHRRSSGRSQSLDSNAKLGVHSPSELVTPGSPPAPSQIDHNNSSYSAEMDTTTTTTTTTTATTTTTTSDTTSATTTTSAQTSQSLDGGGAWFQNSKLGVHSPSSSPRLVSPPTLSQLCDNNNTDDNNENENIVSQREAATPSTTAQTAGDNNNESQSIDPICWNQNNLKIDLDSTRSPLVLPPTASQLVCDNTNNNIESQSICANQNNSKLGVHSPSELARSPSPLPSQSNDGAEQSAVRPDDSRPAAPNPIQRSQSIDPIYANQNNSKLGVHSPGELVDPPTPSQLNDGAGQSEASENSRPAAPNPIQRSQSIDPSYERNNSKLSVRSPSELVDPPSPSQLNDGAGRSAVRHNTTNSIQRSQSIDPIYERNNCKLGVRSPGELVRPPSPSQLDDGASEVRHDTTNPDQPSQSIDSNYESNHSKLGAHSPSSLVTPPSPSQLDDGAGQSAVRRNSELAAPNRIQQSQSIYERNTSKLGAHSPTQAQRSPTSFTADPNNHHLRPSTSTSVTDIAETTTIGIDSNCDPTHHWIPTELLKPIADIDRLQAQSATKDEHNRFSINVLARNSLLLKRRYACLRARMVALEKVKQICRSNHHEIQSRNYSAKRKAPIDPIVTSDPKIARRASSTIINANQSNAHSRQPPQIPAKKRLKISLINRSQFQSNCTAINSSSSSSSINSDQQQLQQQSNCGDRPRFSSRDERHEQRKRRLPIIRRWSSQCQPQILRKNRNNNQNAASTSGGEIFCPPRWREIANENREHSINTNRNAKIIPINGKKFIKIEPVESSAEEEENDEAEIAEDQDAEEEEESGSDFDVRMYRSKKSTSTFAASTATSSISESRSSSSSSSPVPPKRRQKRRLRLESSRSSDRANEMESEEEDEEEEDDEDDEDDGDDNGEDEEHKTGYTRELNYKVKVISLDCLVPTCDQLFERHRELHEHLRNDHQHTYTCDYFDCQETFDLYDKIGIHIARYHTTETDWQCSHCEMNFTAFRFLRAHTRNVHQAGTFQCEQCGFYADRRCIVWRHYKTEHRAARRWLCSFTPCSASFRLETKREKHELTVHLDADRTYKCVYGGNCEYGAATLLPVRRHVVERHFRADYRRVRTTLIALGDEERKTYDRFPDRHIRLLCKDGRLIERDFVLKF